MARQARSRSASATAVQGGLVGIEADGVLGWARDPAQPEAPVQVHLVANGAAVGAAVANQFEDARIRTLVGPGIAGFTARLAATPPGPYPLQLSLHDAGGAMLGPALLVADPIELAGVVGLAAMGNYDGSLDGVFEGALKGWVRDADRPEAAIDVELLDAGRVLARAGADQLRGDLRDAGLHHGLYGYTFDLPVTLLDGRAHSLSVRIAGTDIVLRGGPITFGPLATSALMAQLGALQTEIAALRRLVDGLVAPDGDVQRRIMRVLSERLVAQADIRRDQIERELAVLRSRLG